MSQADSGSNTEDARKKKKPLKISCTNTDCKNGLHYFGPNGRTKSKSKYPVGKCADCGADFVDWQKIGTRRPQNDQYKLEMLQKEWIRHYYWEHKKPTQREINYAKRKGTKGLQGRAEEVLRGKVFAVSGWLNDVQTGYSGVIESAQHATATCCRKCIAYWHGVPVDAKPTEDQITYLRQWIMKYIAARFPDISAEGEYVPPIKNKPS